MSSTASAPYHHRRRSHSASSSVQTHSSRRLSTGSWRATHKRSRPTTRCSPSYNEIASDAPPEKWDVDLWRRGKKVRKSSGSPRIFSGALPYSFMTGGSSSGLQDTVPFTCSFPSTSASFQFFPDRFHKSPEATTQSPDTSTNAFDDTAMTTADDVNQLRTDAFWELHRSVEENGEGLVNRMRDWESSQSHMGGHNRRTSSSQQQPWSRKRSIPQSWTFDASEDDSDNEDDVQIISGESPSPDASPSRGPPRKKRAFSLSVMDVDHPSPYNPYLTPESSERCSSPVDARFASMSETYSDDDDEVGGSSPPALTHAYTNSAASSFISLALPPAHTAGPSHLHPGTGPLVSHNASRTEKAIAALSLALANGAGGLNDYEALRMSEDKTSALDESLVGEMWD